MKNFRHDLTECHLRGLDFVRIPFTCSNGREWEYLISKHLDRCISNTSWWNSFLNYIVNHISAVYLNHTPVCLNIMGDSSRYCYGKKPFRFESMWVGHEECSSE